MAAPKKETAPKASSEEVVALQNFRDKETKIFYEAGSDASTFKGQRLAELQNLGLVSGGDSAQEGAQEPEADK
jgi:hypothetical protein